MMVQLDIEIQSYLAQGQTLEKMSKYKEAIKALMTGKQLLE